MQQLQQQLINHLNNLDIDPKKRDILLKAIEERGLEDTKVLLKIQAVLEQQQKVFDDPLQMLKK